MRLGLLTMHLHTSSGRTRFSQALLANLDTEEDNVRASRVGCSWWEGGKATLVVRRARSVGPESGPQGRAGVGKANLDTEGEVLRQIDQTQQL